MIAHIAGHPPEFTALLHAWGQGDAAAFDRLVPLVHPELHQIARRCMAGEKAGHSMQATALVNEAYLKLVDPKHITVRDRAHFFALSRASCGGFLSITPARGGRRSAADSRAV